MKERGIKFSEGHLQPKQASPMGQNFGRSIFCKFGGEGGGGYFGSATLSFRCLMVTYMEISKRQFHM